MHGHVNVKIHLSSKITLITPSKCTIIFHYMHFTVFLLHILLLYSPSSGRILCPILKTTFCNAALSMVSAIVASSFIRGTTLCLLHYIVRTTVRIINVAQLCYVNVKNPINLGLKSPIYYTIYILDYDRLSFSKSWQYVFIVLQAMIGSVGYKIRRRPRVYKQIQPCKFSHKIKFLQTLLCLRIYIYIWSVDSLCFGRDFCVVALSCFPFHTTAFRHF